jgi:hypothetical protein
MVKVLMDQWGGINEYDINKAGNLSLTLTLTSSLTLNLTDPNPNPHLTLTLTLNLTLILTPGRLKSDEHDFEVLRHMHGKRDERVVHQGSPADDEKFVVSQWGWTGPYNLEKHVTVAEVTKPLNDGMTL